MNNFIKYSYTINLKYIYLKYISDKSDDKATKSLQESISNSINVSKSDGQISINRESNYKNSYMNKT